METIDRENRVKERNHDTTSFTSSLNSKIGLVSNNQGKDSEATRRFYYTVGEFNILIEKDLKAENLQDLTINTVPNAPAWCAGIVSVRGVIMPVIDMHVFLNTEKASPEKNNLLMLEHKNHAPIIIQTNDLPTSTNLSQYSTMKRPKSAPPWVTNLWKSESASIFEVNHNQLLKQFTQY